MQYDLQKLERMSLDAVREIARTMGLNPRRSQSQREISYAILDAQADNRAAVVQAKEEARAAAGKPAKRERVRGVQRTATKVNTSNLKSEQAVATVGSEQEEMAQMQEQLKANNHKPNKTVKALQTVNEDLLPAAPQAESNPAPAAKEEVKANPASAQEEEKEARCTLATHRPSARRGQYHTAHTRERDLSCRRQTTSQRLLGAKSLS